MRGQRWTPAENELLRKMWGEYSERELRNRFAPRRTWTAIYDHATVTLGLPRGAPQGHLYITQVARLCGYTTQAMVTILRWAGVAMHRAYSGPQRPRKMARRTDGTPRRRSTRHIVDLDDARDAVEKWLDAETISESAARLGVPRPTLCTAMRETGALAPQFKAPGVAGYRLPRRTADVAWFLYHWSLARRRQERFAALKAWARDVRMIKRASRLGGGIYEYDGRRMSMVEWAASLGVDRSTLWVTRQREIARAALRCNPVQKAA